MLIKTRGIVFRQIKYGESSFILDILTESEGLKSFMVHGVRKTKPSVAPALVQVMSLVELVAYDKRTTALGKIKEMKSAWPYRHLPFSVAKSAIGQFLLEVTRHALQESEAHPELFEFVYETLVYLDETEHQLALYPVLYLLELGRLIGFQIQPAPHPGNWYFDLQEGQFSASAPYHRYYLEPALSGTLDQVMQVSLFAGHQLAIPKAARKELLEHLLLFYQLHLDHFGPIHSHHILATILK
ncbi:MAG: DNA repair protein RecO [Saprospiraceae bacterium]|nr:DNA repair protein RecO [Saprospiraceae bacterium]